MQGFQNTFVVVVLMCRQRNTVSKREPEWRLPAVVQSPNTCLGWGWAKVKAGAGNSGRPRGWQRLNVLSQDHCLPGVVWAGTLVSSWAIWHPTQRLMWGTDIWTTRLNAHCKLTFRLRDFVGSLLQTLLFEEFVWSTCFDPSIQRRAPISSRPLGPLPVLWHLTSYWCE